MAFELLPRADTFRTNFLGEKSLAIVKRYVWKGRKWPHFLREWRKSRGLSLDHVAQAIGVSKSTLHRIEVGKQSYYQDILEALAVEYGCEPQDMLMRRPADPLGLWETWNKIRADDQPQAIEILRVLAQKSA